MGFLRPGGFKITEEALERSGLLAECLRPGAVPLRVLDIGAGEGDALAFLKKKYRMSGVGLDISEEMVKRAKGKHAGLKFQTGDAEQLDFPSFTFDLVLMECTLSLIFLQMEALHEAYCVLKKGGILIINDLYARETDPESVRAAREAAKAERAKPHAWGDCNSGRETAPSEYCLDGAFVKESLLELCEEVGFETVAWTDKTEDLQSFVAEVIMEHGSLEEYFAKSLPGGAEPSQVCKTDCTKKVGYFTLILKKPND